MADRHVDFALIGGGLAAGNCARWLRESGADGTVLLVGREPDPPYNRPPCSKGYLQGKESPRRYPVSAIRVVRGAAGRGTHPRLGDAARRRGPVPYFFSDLSDWASLEYVGPASQWEREIVRGAIDQGEFSIWYLDDGRLAAALPSGAQTTWITPGD